jgi:protein SCO1/2
MWRSTTVMAGFLLWLLVGQAAYPAMGHNTTGESERLPVIGPAPDFSLTSQDGAAVSLADYRGRVVVVTFIFTTCMDTCPLLTAKMAGVQNDLGDKFGTKIAFVSITVDPEHDTPAVLKDYAETFGADLKGWAFLTGEPAAIDAVGNRYGIYAGTNAAGSVDHTFLTSIIDSKGNLRVQYLGVRFDPNEFKHDLLGLLDEAH